MMSLTVRAMVGTEVDLIIDCFQKATLEYLETLGVYPTRLPATQVWRDRLRGEAELPFDQRAQFPSGRHPLGIRVGTG